MDFKNLGTEFKVGLFTLGAAVVIGYMFLFLNPKMFESSSMKTYYTVMKNAGGLVPNNHVRTNGVLVGKVNTVKLEDTATKVTFEVSADIKIPKGSTIELKSKGFFGDIYMEIVRTDGSGEPIESGGLVPYKADAMDMGEVMSLVGDIAKDVKKVTVSLANAMGDDKGQKRVEEIVINIQEFTKSVKEILAENRGDVRALVSNLEKTSETLRNVIGNNEADLNSIVKNVRATSQDLKEFAANLREVLNDENKQKVDRILASFDESMVDVKGATKNIRLISDKIEKGEGTLGKLINDDAALNDIQGAIKDLREVLAPVTKLQLIVDYHGEVRRDETTQHYFNVQFQTRPDRYYLVGFTDKQNQVIETNNETLESEPATDDRPAHTKTRETIKTENAIRFNLQFSKRWYNIAGRFGLFESTGGLASDMYLFSDRLRFSVEAFDWKTKDNPYRRVAHLKSYASLTFFNHLYALGGVDDFTRLDPKTGEKDPKTNYFLGAGMSFNDQDLKAVFGAAALAK